jgi:hypothetical protein
MDKRFIVEVEGVPPLPITNRQCSSGGKSMLDQRAAIGW